MATTDRFPTLRIPSGCRPRPEPPPQDEVAVAEPAPYDADQEQPGSGGYDQLLDLTHTGPARHERVVIRAARLKTQSDSWRGPAITTTGRPRSTRAW